MSESSTKQCIACCEPIAVEAKRCPKCSQWQSKWSMRARSPLGWVCTVVFLFMVFALFMWGVQYLEMRRLSSSGDFEKYKSQFTITTLQINYSTSERGAYISTLGTLKNNTDKTWERPVVEVKYYNDQKQLIDTTEDSLYSLSIPPHSEVSFKARGPADRPKEDYVTSTMRLLSANQAGKPF